MLQSKFDLTPFRKSFGEWPETVLSDSVNLTLQSVQLMSLSTGTGAPNVCPVYFTLYDETSLCFVLNLNSMHAKLLGKTDAASVAIYDSSRPRTSPKIGIQMIGSCKQASVAESLKVRLSYAERFHANIEDAAVKKVVSRSMGGFRFFLFTPTEIKILDEPRFGEETYITLVREP